VDTDKLIKFSAKGRLLAEETNEALAAELAKHERAVLPGFYGSTPDGEIKTFSRGGSDITGALVARAVHAARWLQELQAQTYMRTGLTYRDS